MYILNSITSTVVFLLHFNVSACFSPKPLRNNNVKQLHRGSRRTYISEVLKISGGATLTSREDTKLSAVNLHPAVASLIAGSLAGAIGIGVAFPLDTLKTKSQVLGQQKVSISDATGISIDVSQMNMIQLIGFIYSKEGIEGFFGGVKGMMVGQALIKSVAFASNSMSLSYLQTNFGSLSSTSALLLAACNAGFVTSFFVTPIERIKVMMQASKKYKNEFICLKAILQTEGVGGLFGRGLGTTLGREIPSYGIYFFIYGFFTQLSFLESLGNLAPLLFGALSGMASWLPVYPIDVVKTLVQNTDGTDKSSTFEIAKHLYNERGIGGFFDGILPKMLRAGINHAVTFFCYDAIMRFLLIGG